MYTGQRVDARFKELVKNEINNKNSVLYGLKITQSGKVGADFFDDATKAWWDLTTRKDWIKGTHQTRYDKLGWKKGYGKAGIYWD